MGIESVFMLAGLSSKAFTVFSRGQGLICP
jgi:hypothetical protein